MFITYSELRLFKKAIILYNKIISCMESISLYDLLVGTFISMGDDPGDVDLSYFDRISEDEKLRRSIVENLKMVLQTRRGSVQHLPDFGIPDIRKVYFDEGTIDAIPKQIAETITKYEPRLTGGLSSLDFIISLPRALL